MHSLAPGFRRGTFELDPCIPPGVADVVGEAPILILVGLGVSCEELCSILGLFFSVSGPLLVDTTGDAYAFCPDNFWLVTLILPLVWYCLLCASVDAAEFAAREAAADKDDLTPAWEKEPALPLCDDEYPAENGTALPPSFFVELSLSEGLKAFPSCLFSSTSSYAVFLFTTLPLLLRCCLKDCSIPLALNIRVEFEFSDAGDNGVTLVCLWAL